MKYSFFKSGNSAFCLLPGTVALQRRNAVALEPRCVSTPARSKLLTSAKNHSISLRPGFALNTALVASHCSPPPCSVQWSFCDLLVYSFDHASPLSSVLMPVEDAANQFLGQKALSSCLLCLMRYFLLQASRFFAQF